MCCGEGQFRRGISARCSRRPRSVLVQVYPSPLLNSSKTASGGGLGGRRMTEASTRARTPAMDGTASPNIHTIVKAQIVFLLSTLTEENFERNQVEIRSVSETFACSGEGVSSSVFCRHNLRVCSYPSSMELTRTSTLFAVSSFTLKPDLHPPHPPLHSTLHLP